MPTLLDSLPWPLRTRRLTIRPAVEDDAVTTWRYRKLEEVSRWLTSAPDTFEAYHALFTDPERLDRTMVIDLDGVVVGDLKLDVEDAWAQSEVADRATGVQAELGWTLDPAYQGHGYATEAVAALVRVCFEDLSLHRVTAACFADNEGSWRLMERLGMRREAYNVRDSLHRSGVWLDGMEYALLAEEWAASRDASPTGAAESGAVPAGLD